ncbi:MAG: TonB-dependent receptor [Zoogloeaceae bacterium]|jgi:iron complex outermembrane receptor protein|nr:TonB-dependent receptor [Zoogloeaceae bacterium]
MPALNKRRTMLGAAILMLWGQTQAQTLAHDPDQEPLLEDVVVTARHGEERAMDVPFGISVIRGEDLEQQRAQTVEEALTGVAGVVVNSYGGEPNSANVLIRGNGALNQVSVEDSSVALIVDGVAMSIRDVGLGTLDVDRIEILKGPQGTLFGGNGQAGAINVVNNRPTRVFEGHVRGEYGQDRQHLEEVVVSGPLSERLSGRFALRNSGAEHWIKNAQDGKPIAKPVDLAFRGSLSWEIAEHTNLLLSAERHESQYSPSLAVLRPYTDAPLDFTPGLFDDNHKIIERQTVEFKHDLRNSRITSITAHTFVDYATASLYDRRVMQALFGMPIENQNLTRSRRHVVSEDLRWSSLPGAAIFWVTGLNLSHSRRSFDTLTTATGSASEREYETDSRALYGELTYPLTDTLKLTGGLRHSWDRKTYDGVYDGAGGDHRKLSDDYTTGRLALSYALTPSLNIFGAFSHGYQSGGFGDFPTQAADSAPYKASSSNAIEIGFKMESPDRRLSLNGALFLSKVKDDHLLGYDYATYTTNTINADTENKGGELEGVWRVGRGFEIQAGVSYIDAKITRDVFGVSGGDVQNGNRKPDVPRWSGTVAFSHHVHLAEFMGLSAPMLNSRLSYRYMGKRPADAQNHYDLDSYHKVDLRIGVVSGAAEIYLYGDNLLDEAYEHYGYWAAPGVTMGVPARGRTLGVGMRYFF